MVIGRQRRIIERAKRTNEIIASFFPKEIRERMLRQAEDQDKNNMFEKAEGLFEDVSREEFRAAVQVDADGEDDDKVIADYFPSATIIFQDLVGFTAWSCKYTHTVCMSTVLSCLALTGFPLFSAGSHT